MARPRCRSGPRVGMRESQDAVRTIFVSPPTGSPTVLAIALFLTPARLKERANSQATRSAPPSVLSSWMIWMISSSMAATPGKRNETASFHENKP